MIFYGSNHPTNSVKALNEVVVLRIGFNPTRSTSPFYNNTTYNKHIIRTHTNESQHSEMGPGRQNPIQRPVKLFKKLCNYTMLHNTTQVNSSVNRETSKPQGTTQWGKIWQKCSKIALLMNQQSFSINNNLQMEKYSGEVLAWLSGWSEVQMICIQSSWWCHCHPIISCSSEIQNGLPFWCHLTQVVLEKALKRM